MKRTILIALVSVFIVGFSYPQAFAKDKSLPLSASASSEYASGYTATEAVDGNYASFWVGGKDTAPWWIMFDAGEITQIDKINIEWFSSYEDSIFFVPQDYDIQISFDGFSWETIYSGLSGTPVPGGETKDIVRITRYIRLYIHTVPVSFPVIREFTAYSKINVPHLIRFQANLGDAQGASLDGTFTLTFRLYNAETGGTSLWEEVQQNINVVEGDLDVELGSITALDLVFDEQYWLGVEVETDGEMAPRFKLTTVPYSYTSE